MSRQDLLALTTDDLTVLSNRGLVKRALKELEEGKLSYELTQDTQGNISVRWSDVECILPATEELSDRHCNCSATTVCRHLIRSILIYQRTQEAKPDSQTSSQFWNPGDISDAELSNYFNKTIITRAKSEFDSGHVIELIKSNKPVARIHTLAYTVRFLVPGDIRYTYCDCSEPAPCRHVLYSVWAFRKLQPEQISGIISTQQEAAPIPVDVLNDIEDNLNSLLKSGIRGVNKAYISRLRRLEQNCRASSLIWLAEIIAEIIQETERYESRDARFSPIRVVELVGELCIRSDAIRNDTGAVPQLFIRGSQTDKLTDIGAARLISLGCGVQVRHKNVQLTTYLQDTDSGSVVAIYHDFPDSQDDNLVDFWQLAQNNAFKQVSFATLSAGQMLVKGGKRTPNYQFLPGRAQVVVNPQTFEWESLRPPLLVEDFNSLRAYLELLPPTSLRPRRLTENFYVFQIHQLQSVEFCNVEQVVKARLFDQSNNQAVLKFPYLYRSRIGTEALLKYVTNPLLFVAGHAHLTTEGLVIIPVSLIFEVDNKRVMLQPWICGADFERVKYEGELLLDGSQLDLSNKHPINLVLEELQQVLSDSFIIGLERVDAQVIHEWRRVYSYGQSIGFSYLLEPISKLVKIFEQRLERENGAVMSEAITDFNSSVAQLVLQVCVLVRLSQDI
ncbi:hypothetical protein DSM106972_078530 [Dulcicalothrix desertica PCC 7102]|uniref:SWIM-type domain-containing protein n=1 Tax=Dulcicalothrix desertica PCC 7102 TaxID=232991 RepID=A0A3S1ILJ6_9CYAN|nr:hypothetical protein [Dulcicalothrix desertica]RUS99151.1 hypothetical protein DSM106972_078530 [Dulcicalothrix desertica PCC 7102]TWH61005.1 hypothetical protein CAL7102_01082 [Dulcicalothrix desertica PCC 7102]